MFSNKNIFKENKQSWSIISCSRISQELNLLKILRNTDLNENGKLIIEFKLKLKLAVMKWGLSLADLRVKNIFNNYSASLCTECFSHRWFDQSLKIKNRFWNNSKTQKFVFIRGLNSSEPLPLSYAMNSTFT